ncbi:S8 family serine peptidase [Nonomuraea sp. NPDC051191]|uniref:S8 family serine peptidase n=1 Tax=Nonomuraea sp. NPDC051191 TaxID=3364372 RepID=UPI00378CFF18
MTLLTGDRVVVSGQAHQVVPGPGRDVDFMSQVVGGHLFVIPSDVRPLIARGVLDRRLFDVTQLLQWGYGDAERPDIPLITQSAPGLRGARQLGGLGMSALSLPKSDAATTWQSLAGNARSLQATKIWLDGKRTYTLDKSTAQIGATEAWKQGLTGEGVTVAVLDSGYDPDHPDLKGVVSQERNFSTDPDITDPLGHGTHVASIIASNDATYRGVAPGARLAIGKVGGAAGASESAIVAGMDWAANEVKAKVINFSMAAPDQPGLDPVEQAVNALSASTGALFVVGAGNSGRAPVSSPASADAALAVGAVDRDDKIADFSSTGPREGDHAVKPDITAPGIAIMAAEAGGGHVAMDGTSMATPHVAGAAAILAQRHPDWSGQRLKAVLMGSAIPAEGTTPYQQGSGRVDVVRALKLQVTAEAKDAWAAFRWDGQNRVQRGTITYANAGDSLVSLALRATDDMVKLSAATLKVPAGGQASVDVIVDASGKAPGDHVAIITATSGDTLIRTMAGAYVEPESYDLTIKALSANGEPADAYAQIYDPRTNDIREVSVQAGTGTIRLSKGDWNVYAEVAVRPSKVIFHDAIKLDSPGQSITIDARSARTAKIGVDDPSAVVPRGYTFQMEYGRWRMLMSGGSPDASSHFRFIPVRQAGLRASISTIWKAATPYVLVAHYENGFPDDPSYVAKRAELAKVSATYRGAGVAAKGTPIVGNRLGDSPSAALSPVFSEVDLPSTQTYYRTPGVVYDSGLMVGDAVMTDSGRTTPVDGVQELWNIAVAGPSPGSGSRTRDTITIAAGSLFADGNPGHAGTDGAATGTAILTSGGKIVTAAELAGCRGDAPETCMLSAEVPAEEATYTLTTSMRRQVDHSTLSTAVESVWTFRSGHAAQTTPLSLVAVRYAPIGLDSLNQAKAGTVTRVPIWVEGGQRAVSVEMSSDDGKSWHQVPLVKGSIALVPNPSQASFISLRAKVPGSLEQTIIRAYAVK